MGYGKKGKPIVIEQPSLTEVKSELAQRPTKTEVDTQVAAVASGTPKGVYATVTDLETAFPSGDSSIYVVSADGNWYYWNGSAWTSGGVYQSTGIAEKSVGMKETAYPMVEGVPSKNLFDGETEYGSYDWSGNKISSSTKIRNKNIIKVDKGSIITTQVFNTDKNDIVYLFEYDINKNYIKYDTILTSVSTIQLDANAEYVNFRSNDTEKPLSFFNDNVQIVQGSEPLPYENKYPKLGDDSVTLAKMSNFKYVIPANIQTWILGSISSTDGSVNTSYSNRIVTPSLIYFNKDDYLEVKNGYMYLIAKYAEDGVNEWVDDFSKTAPYTFSENGYYRIAIKKEDDSDLTNLIEETSANGLVLFMKEKTVSNRNVEQNSLNVDRFDSSLESFIEEMSGTFSTNTFPRQKFSTDIICSDIAMVGNELWAFGTSSDDHSTFGDLKRYSIDFENETYTLIGSLKHNWGHCNTVDYCEGSDTIILGNGGQSTTAEGKIFIIPSASALKALPDGTQLPLVDYGITIDCAGYGFGSKFQVVWGESNGDYHNIAYLITNDNKNFRRLLLGQGSNQFEFGQFISEKSENEFNGTFKVLAEFSQPVANQNNGTTYRNGYIYAGGKHDGLSFLKILLSENGKALVETFRQVIYDPTGTAVPSIYTNGIAITDKYLLIGGYTETRVMEYNS